MQGEGVLNCQVSTGTSADVLLDKIADSSANGTALDRTSLRRLIPIALVIQREIILYLLVAAFSFFLLGLAFFIWLRLAYTKQERPAPPKFKRITIGSIWGSSAFALASTVSVHQTTSALQFMSVEDPGAPFEVRAGASLRTFSWLILTLSVLFALGASSIMRNASALPPPAEDPGKVENPGEPFPAEYAV